MPTAFTVRIDQTPAAGVVLATVTGVAGTAVPGADKPFVMKTGAGGAPAAYQRVAGVRELASLPDVVPTTALAEYRVAAVQVGGLDPAAVTAASLAVRDRLSALARDLDAAAVTASSATVTVTAVSA